MDRQHDNVKEIFSCVCCKQFHSLHLKELMNHYYIVHSTDLNFQVTCNVRGCPKKFFIYNSLYKHVIRKHKDVYLENAYPRNILEENLNEIGDVDDVGEDSYLSDHSDNNNNEENQQEEQQNSLEIQAEHNSDYYDSDNTEPTDEEDEDEEFEDNGGTNNLEKITASFILKTKEKNGLTQVSTDNILQNVRCLMQQYFTKLKGEIDTVLLANGCEHLEAIDNVFESFQDPFLTLSTASLQESYIKENFPYVAPIEIELGKVISRKRSHGQSMLCEIPEKFVYIPILESLKTLLSNTSISKLILKEPDFCEKGVYYDICDGSIFRDDEYFKTHPNALSLILYHDEIDVCNPLGSHATTHKLDMYYYTLSNLSPKYRSKHSAVRLLAIANAKLVKKYGIEKIMEPIISDVLLLNHGFDLGVQGHEKVFGRVFTSNGDTLGQNFLGGFKEGVGGAFQKCRVCHCTFEDMQTKFLEEDFNLRTIEGYEEQCNEIENAPSKEVAENLSTAFGINKRSSLCRLPSFDITKQMPHDIMHILLEGSVQYELNIVLNELRAQGCFNLDQINRAISNHGYSFNEISSKPPPLRKAVFTEEETHKIKFNAAQSKTFLKLFPFIMHSFVSTDNELYLFVIDLIEIVALVFAPVIKSDGINDLENKISAHLKRFKELFPEKNIIPKQHFTLHFPTSIRETGPMIRASCFSFEAAHNFFKILARKQNFKNICLSLAKRIQMMDACNFGDAASNPSAHPLFKTDKQFGVVKKVNDDDAANLRNSFTFHGLLPGLNFDNVYKVSWYMKFGTRFKKDDLVIIGVKNNLPVFGKITVIWYVFEYVYFEIIPMITTGFIREMQSYKVKFPSTPCSSFAASDCLVDYNSYNTISLNNNLYIPPKYNLEYILQEFSIGRNPLDF